MSIWQRYFIPLAVEMDDFVTISAKFGLAQELIYIANEAQSEGLECEN